MIRILKNLQESAGDRHIYKFIIFTCSSIKPFKHEKYIIDEIDEARHLYVIYEKSTWNIIDINKSTINHCNHNDLREKVAKKYCTNYREILCGLGTTRDNKTDPLHLNPQTPYLNEIEKWLRINHICYDIE